MDDTYVHETKSTELIFFFLHLKKLRVEWCGKVYCNDEPLDDNEQTIYWQTVTMNLWTQKVANSDTGEDCNNEPLRE